MNIDERLDQLSRELLSVPYGQLNEVQRSVIDLICAEAPTGLNAILVNDDRSFWDRLADKVAAVGGSWAFIGGFSAALLVWTAVNVALKPLNLAFDPYPFIFLNLLLSTVAALQAPVIMMSQNRQALKDRQNAEHDYVVNLRAELEIMHLHDKLDALRERDIVELGKQHAEALGRLEAQMTALTARLEAKG
ncbi:DUF1003 domain-containing protein [Caulobacter sp. FWC2]|uniref:DUF1003 domain-containing protein n=1 Tax=Caulobacter sp. FWC2 TaxID=69664 RepID=UPI000C158E4A|nr:DUF1003 domain-containing protein [Caulobacter sp. FWC2]PIB93700.1 hypothetical protein CSW62_20250 [Caulobacter sp. FWC2]